MSSILVLDGHPNPESLCAALAQSYADAAGARLIAVRDLDFSAHMRHGYRRHLEVEPDLAQARAAIRTARHLVVVTPVWWRSTPAMLKGLLDRAFLPKEEFTYGRFGIPQGLLKGRSARVIVTSDTPTWLHRVMPDTKLRSLSRGTLAFCGFSPVRVTHFAPVKQSTPQRRAEWLQQVAELGAEDAQRVGIASPDAQSRSTTKSMQRVSAVTSSGSTAGYMPTRS